MAVDLWIYFYRMVLLRIPERADEMNTPRIEGFSWQRRDRGLHLIIAASALAAMLAIAVLSVAPYVAAFFLVVRP